ncbi:TPA: terminase, partial [Escherichia coli]|nr:terminase [Escherichia coli]HDS0509632.1 terminase [Escherichia coli]
KRFRAEVLAKIEARMNALEKQAKSGDTRLSLETLKMVREQIYGVIS